MAEAPSGVLRCEPLLSDPGTPTTEARRARRWLAPNADDVRPIGLLRAQIDGDGARAKTPYSRRMVLPPPQPPARRARPGAPGLGSPRRRQRTPVGIRIIAVSNAASPRPGSPAVGATERSKSSFGRRHVWAGVRRTAVRRSSVSAVRLTVAAGLTADDIVATRSSTSRSAADHVVSRAHPRSMRIESSTSANSARSAADDPGNRFVLMTTTVPSMSRTNTVSSWPGS
jgi:hypothetical protein